ncbi:Glycosyl hydrolases family 35 [Streptomyces sp. yr375]|uniref:beta-galactosidase n=1 Tax=Streptomyces sp. yr375 TaxID=1761906 RepID=UPI0008C09ACF|nr:Glycosyl hydrolases family 35 [Streptomyces sp. yr375]
MAASGGPVIAVQVENEYGPYGDDPAYLKHVERAFRAGARHRAYCSGWPQAQGAYNRDE